MKGTRLLEQTALYLKRHSPTILTCVGAVGVIVTTASAIKATPKAIEILDSATNEKGDELTTFEIVQLVGPTYFPAIVFGLSTIACIFGANVLNKKQQATIVSAYALLNRTYQDYKGKVIDLYGKDGDENIRSEIVKDKFKDVDISASGENLIFYLEPYGKFFERTMAQVQDAEYQINRKFALEGEVSLNDFFEFLGLPRSEAGEALGWSQEASYDFYNYCWIEFEHKLVKTDDDVGGFECYIIDMPYAPSVGYSIPF